jgi:hypothetical protein
MKDNDFCLRLTVRIHNPMLIEKMNLLPNGFKSRVIELALAAYLEIKAGRDVFDTLQHYPKQNHHIVQKPPQPIQNNILNRLTGDF